MTPRDQALDGAGEARIQFGVSSILTVAGLTATPSANLDETIVVALLPFSSANQRMFELIISIKYIFFERMIGAPNE